VTAGTVTGAVGTIKYSWKTLLALRWEQLLQLRTCLLELYMVSDDCSSKSNSVTVGQPAAALAFSFNY
jgi:hypothetical protein